MRLWPLSIPPCHSVSFRGFLFSTCPFRHLPFSITKPCIFKGRVPAHSLRAPTQTSRKVGVIPGVGTRCKGGGWLNVGGGASSSFGRGPQEDKDAAHAHLAALPFARGFVGAPGLSSGCARSACHPLKAVVWLHVDACALPLQPPDHLPTFLMACISAVLDGTDGGEWVGA